MGAYCALLFYSPASSQFPILSTQAAAPFTIMTTLLGVAENVSYGLWKLARSTGMQHADTHVSIQLWNVILELRTLCQALWLEGAAALIMRPLVLLCCRQGSVASRNHRTDLVCPPHYRDGSRAAGKCWP